MATMGVGPTPRLLRGVVSCDPDDTYWGPVTSTVNWCEDDYVFTCLVAEWFNTISSFAMIIAGILGLYLHPWAERRFKIAFATVSVVGIGSTAFHATLLFEAQLLDEVPMLYSALTMVFILLEIKSPVGEPRFGAKLPRALTAHAVLTTLLVSLSSGSMQFALFHLSFGTAEVFSLYRTWQLSRETNHPGWKMLFRYGMGMFALGVVCWFADFLACPFWNEVLPNLGIPNPQFHAWWHVFVSAGLYVLWVLLLSCRMSIAGEPYDCKWLLGVIPYVYVSPEVAARLSTANSSSKSD